MPSFLRSGSFLHLFKQTGNVRQLPGFNQLAVFYSKLAEGRAKNLSALWCDAAKLTGVLGAQGKITDDRVPFRHQLVDLGLHVAEDTAEDLGEELARSSRS